MVDSLAPPGGPALGYRRNHAKGICFSGTFESSGAASTLSRAELFAPGSYPVTGRFNLAGPDPKMADGTGRVRGLGLRVQTPGRQEWRTAMINAPFFPAATVQDFYDLQVASAKKGDPDAMKNYAAAHPALRAFGGWAGSAPFAESYAEDRFNSLDSFIFTNAQGQSQAVRWSFVPAATPVAVPPDELKKRPPDFLEQDITTRVAGAPQKWTLVLTVANPGDPTADPSLAGRSPPRRGRHARGQPHRAGGRRPLPRPQLRSDRAARRHRHLRRSLPRRQVGRLRGVVRPPHRRGEGLRARPRRRPAVNTNRLQFTPLQRGLHWVMAIGILAMLFIGVGMVSTVGPAYLSLVSLHKPLGILILVLALVRLAVRLRYGAPALPADLPEPMKLAAKLSHMAFYVLMIALPLIGWAMLSAASYPVVVAGFELPPIVPHDAALHSVLWNAHRALALCLFALYLLHLAAALFHAWVRRDGVFEAMAGGAPATTKR